MQMAQASEKTGGLNQLETPTSPAQSIVWTGSSRTLLKSAP